MKVRLKLLFLYVMKIVLKVFWLFPVKENRLIFYSHEGKSFSCNPKYIYLYLRNQAVNNFDFVWVLNKKQNIGDLEGVKQVKSKSLEFFYYLLTSKVIINNDIAPSYFPVRKSQCIIGTWHGGGSYKKWGIDVYNDSFNRKIFNIIADNVTYVSSSCKAFSDSLINACLIDNKKILPIGMPRNDLLFNNSEKKISQIKEKLNIPAVCKVVLYAPTFRGVADRINSSVVFKGVPFDYDVLVASLNKRFSGEWTILFRAHHTLQECISPGKMIDVSSYPDMQELLLISDVLINDYSSSMWDFSLMKKPCFIYADDIEEYSHTRGFYTPMDRWPFPIASTQEELIQKIEQFDEETYIKAVDRHHEELGSYETGTATETICKIICDFCRVTLDEI